MAVGKLPEEAVYSTNTVRPRAMTAYKMLLFEEDAMIVSSTRLNETWMTYLFSLQILLFSLSREIVFKIIDNFIVKPPYAQQH